MKVKLSNNNIINTAFIKQLRNKKVKLQAGLNKIIKPKYSIEFMDGTFTEISKQEYKLLKRMWSNE